MSTLSQEVCKWRLGGVRARRLPWLWGGCRDTDVTAGDRPGGRGPVVGREHLLPCVGAGGPAQAQPLLGPPALWPLGARFQRGTSSLPAGPPGFGAECSPDRRAHKRATCRQRPGLQAGSLCVADPPWKGQCRLPGGPGSHSPQGAHRHSGKLAVGLWSPGISGACHVDPVSALAQAQRCWVDTGGDRLGGAAGLWVGRLRA